MSSEPLCKFCKWPSRYHTGDPDDGSCNNFKPDQMIHATTLEALGNECDGPDCETCAIIRRELQQQRRAASLPAAVAALIAQAKTFLSQWNHLDCNVGSDYDDCRRTIVDLCAVFGIAQPPVHADNVLKLSPHGPVDEQTMKHFYGASGYVKPAALDARPSPPQEVETILRSRMEDAFFAGVTRANDPRPIHENFAAWADAPPIPTQKG